ncbi:site-specific tyrosine recombinase XerC [compost metagenome]
MDNEMTDALVSGSSKKTELAPFPVFDSYSVVKTLTPRSPFPESTPFVRETLTKIADCNPGVLEDYTMSIRFLTLMGRKSEQTYNALRIEVERLLLWCWLVQGKSLTALKRADYDAFVEFFVSPPVAWVGSERQHHFVEREGSGGQKAPNPRWKPFRVTGQQLEGRKVVKRTPSPSAFMKLFSSLTSFVDFLVLDGYLEGNPIPAVKKNSPYLIRDVSIRKSHRLSELEWDFVLQTVEDMANANSRYERNLFAVLLLKSCYLRISEIAERAEWAPLMSHIEQKDGYWWLLVYGKGAKLRSVSMSDSILPYLIRYRRSRGLPEAIPADEREPLIHKLKGQGGVSIRQATRIIEESFDAAVQKMIDDGFIKESEQLRLATSHWLRHTGASMDVGIRPLKHLSDDLGHASLATTDRVYVQSDDMERAESGRKRKL